mmetsp:Transcript_43550/g.50177  ORF Transcript_43550/g.50177 Transcript_43550/m.50177 type:complete len:392 (+) Transcript_43550:357-1532(+)
MKESKFEKKADIEMPLPSSSMIISSSPNSTGDGHPSNNGPNNNNSNTTVVEDNPDMHEDTHTAISGLTTEATKGTTRRGRELQQKTGGGTKKMEAVRNIETDKAIRPLLSVPPPTKSLPPSTTLDEQHVTASIININDRTNKACTKNTPPPSSLLSVVEPQEGRVPVVGRNVSSRSQKNNIPVCQPPTTTRNDSEFMLDASVRGAKEAEAMVPERERVLRQDLPRTKSRVASTTTAAGDPTTTSKKNESRHSKDEEDQYRPTAGGGPLPPCIAPASDPVSTYTSVITKEETIEEEATTQEERTTTVATLLVEEATNDDHPQHPLAADSIVLLTTTTLADSSREDRSEEEATKDPVKTHKKSMKSRMSSLAAKTFASVKKLPRIQSRHTRNR